MSDYKQQETILQFWEWFSVNYEDFGENFDNEGLIDELDTQIVAMGDLVWEIGPGINAANQLVISPGGDPGLLAYTKEIIANSINVPNWEYHYAKPPKQWEMIFEFEKQDGERIEINASDWQYVLLRYDDGMYEIILKPANLQSLNEDELFTVGEILIDGILGEEKRITSIYAIDMVDKFETQYANKVNDIKNLVKQIE